jgi:hypothetical protein
MFQDILKVIRKEYSRGKRSFLPLAFPERFFLKRSS